VKDTKNGPDASIDRLLAGSLKARAGESRDGACMDAETLAAWVDGSLDTRERASAEAHAADCARCQALLAAMVKTLPAPTAAGSPWRLPAFGWLVPLTAAATALAIWIAVPRPAPVQVSEVSEVATTVDQVAPAQAPLSAPPAESRAKVQPEPEAELKDKLAPQRAAEGAARSFAAPREGLDAPLEKRPSPPASANNLADAAPISPAAPSAGAAAAPSPAPAAPFQSADATLRRETAQLSARTSAFANVPEVVVVSSNPATRFRLLRGGGVQRSADAGATWRTEVTGATQTLTAGSSPSPSVCWLIGPSGIVLLSTNGASWRRLAFPEAVDLRSVTATDSENATITTADGRTFVTTDSGRTWSRAPGF
jgi:Putative zinc-finger